MQNIDATSTTSSADNGVAGLDRFLPIEDGNTGYGAAVYFGATSFVSRLYNLHDGTLIADLELTGDYAAKSGSELMDVLTDALDRLAEKAELSLSKLSVAAVSGSTPLESRTAGRDQSDLVYNLAAGCDNFGCDVEYMLAGATSIAVGQAFFVPCLDTSIGGDFLCSLLAIDILGSSDPVLFISGGSQDGPNAIIAYGNQEAISVCVLPNGTDVEQGLARLFDLCEAEYSHISKAIIAGDADVVVPKGLMEHVTRIEYPAIIGTSAVLLSEDAEDELCRIVSECQLVNL